MLASIWFTSNIHAHAAAERVLFCAIVPGPGTFLMSVLHLTLDQLPMKILTGLIVAFHRNVDWFAIHCSKG